MIFIKYLSSFAILAIIIFSVLNITAKITSRNMDRGVSLIAAIATTTTKQFDYDLATGSKRSADIFYLQEFLRNQKLFTYPTSTGTYGPATAEAVRKFQIMNSIPATGIFNATTRILANRIIVAKKIKFAQAPASAVKTATTTIATPKPTTTISATSTARDKIKIANVARTSTKPEGQYIVIRNTLGKQPIDVTGFKIVTSINNQYIIPRGHTIPGINPVPQDNVILKLNDTIKIIVGRQINQINFQENLCTGYFDEKVSYGDALSHNCPKPDYLSRVAMLPDYCVAVFDKTPACKTIDTQETQQENCLQFSTDHFNYQGCLRDFRDKTNFLKGNWLVWMQRATTFFRPLHDMVILYDKEGKIVDQYKY
ncbi:MAG: peptidoglycan-binding protein [Candidatus Vogelbacteria bacterium]|nr:peptidoglycan-binding protein [Candidatus Vogelbacteria bacterium]